LDLNESGALPHCHFPFSLMAIPSILNFNEKSKWHLDGESYKFMSVVTPLPNCHPT